MAYTHLFFYLTTHLVVELFDVVHEVVVLDTLVVIDDPVQVGEVSVQVHVVSIGAADQEVSCALREGHQEEKDGHLLS